MVKYISLMCVDARGCRQSDVWRVIFAEYVRLSGEAVLRNAAALHAERSALSTSTEGCLNRC